MDRFETFHISGHLSSKIWIDSDSQSEGILLSQPRMYAQYRLYCMRRRHWLKFTFPIGPLTSRGMRAPYHLSSAVTWCSVGDHWCTSPYRGQFCFLALFAFKWAGSCAKQTDSGSLSGGTQFVRFAQESAHILVDRTVKLPQVTGAFDRSNSSICFEVDLFRYIRYTVGDNS